jgi:endonuclease VIII
LPEGDTIFRTAVSLRRWLGGRVVTAATAAKARVDLSPVVGRRVERVEAQGKHLLIHFSEGLVLHTHMRMTGSWHVYPTGERWRKPPSQARVVIETGERLAVCFNAPVVELLTPKEHAGHGALRRLGPDLLGPQPLDQVEIRARARASDASTVGELLLDQTVVAGIGNIYRCESLFLCRVDPHRPTSDLDDATIEHLVTTAARLLRANAVTSAFDRSFDGGPDRPWVYKRSGRPCRRCGATIRRELLGLQARAVYWCPACQPAEGV